MLIWMQCYIFFAKTTKLMNMRLKIEYQKKKGLKKKKFNKMSRYETMVTKSDNFCFLWIEGCS